MVVALQECVVMIQSDRSMSKPDLNQMSSFSYFLKEIHFGIIILILMSLAANSNSFSVGQNAAAPLQKESNLARVHNVTDRPGSGDIEKGSRAGITGMALNLKNLDNSKISKLILTK
jgi:hypothetical protein